VIRFDIDLFMELNEAYRERPLVPTPRDVRDTNQMAVEGQSRAIKLQKRYAIRGRRVLEVGCGRAAVAHRLAEEYECDVIGLDLREYPEWAYRSSDRLTLRKLDIAAADPSALGSFDFIYAFAVWEHIRHPHRALSAAYKLLRPGGRMYLSANLYRGPKASHRYREVFFPWPHLLFSREVFGEFYTRQFGKPSYPAWVNKLVAAEYLHYFSTIGFEVDRVWYDMTPIDEPLYERFALVLDQYPRFDLERDFIHVNLRRPL
jgi:SAM-dependent methyltransferase